MAFKFSGDFGKLKTFTKRVQQTPSVLKDVVENLAEEALELVKEGFETERDPDGRKWAPLKYRSGKILQDTGRLKNSWHRKAASKKGFTIGSGVAYAAPHQTGTKRGLPKRRMVPSSKKLPARWRKRLVATAREVLDEHFGK
jgi:phage gpG-like protein